MQRNEILKVEPFIGGKLETPLTLPKCSLGLWDVIEYWYQNIYSWGAHLECAFWSNLSEISGVESKGFRMFVGGFTMLFRRCSRKLCCTSILWCGLVKSVPGVLAQLAALLCGCCYYFSKIQWGSVVAMVAKGWLVVCARWGCRVACAVLSWLASADPACMAM